MHRVFICLLIPCFSLTVSAQEIQETPPVKQDFYQIFLDLPALKVNKVTYSNDSGSIQFKLAPDGKSIRLLDYNGSGGVKAEIIYEDGTVKDVIKSKCNVHSLQEL